MLRVLRTLYRQHCTLNLAGETRCRKSKPRHVLIVVSDAFLFPLKTEMTEVDAHALPNLRCYYLEMEPVVGLRFDEIAKVLKPLHPERFSLVHPVHFRRTLAQIIATLGKSN